MECLSSLRRCLSAPADCDTCISANQQIVHSVESVFYSQTEKRQKNENSLMKRNNSNDSFIVFVL